MKDQAFIDFVNEHAKRAAKKRTTTIKNSWGVRDAYKYIRKHKWYNIGRPLQEKEFYAIIRNINKLLAKEIADGKDVRFPHSMGHLELIKYKAGVSMINGKIKNTYPIDWMRTYKLWYEDEEARKAKILVRNENKYIYKIRYNKSNAEYENKIFYGFVLNIFIKKALKENINKGKIEALW